MKGIQLLIEATSVREQLPDADTDVLIWSPGSCEGQLGAYVAEEAGQPVWVDAQGARVLGVTHWARLPLLTPWQQAAGSQR